MGNPSKEPITLREAVQAHNFPKIMEFLRQGTPAEPGMAVEFFKRAIPTLESDLVPPTSAYIENMNAAGDALIQKLDLCTEVSFAMNNAVDWSLRAKALQDSTAEIHSQAVLEKLSSYISKYPARLSSPSASVTLGNAVSIRSQGILSPAMDGVFDSLVKKFQENGIMILQQLQSLHPSPARPISPPPYLMPRSVLPTPTSLLPPCPRTQGSSIPVGFS